jgi:hypothetical protein
MGAPNFCAPLIGGIAAIVMGIREYERQLRADNRAEFELELKHAAEVMQPALVGFGRPEPRTVDLASDHSETAGQREEDVDLKLQVCSPPRFVPANSDNQIAEGEEEKAD